LARPFPCHCWPDLLNALYAYAEAHPQVVPPSPHPGATALQHTIGNLLGLRIDHYALVDLGGFVDVIDALGGGTLDVPEHTVIRLSPPKPGEAWRTFDIPAGRQHLDGAAALAYARNRSDSSDYVRMKRQRCLLGAVAKDVDPAALVRAFPRLVDVLRQRVVTDIAVAELPNLIKLAKGIQPDALKSVGLVPPRYSAGVTPDRYPIPNVPLIQQTARTIFAQPAPSEQAAAASRVETAAHSCGWSAAP
jgi:LCP family protein required for cell wall assembly